MRIALAQFNPVVGDIAGNTQAILKLAKRAKTQGADMLVTPELALTGYPLEDLLLRDALYPLCHQAIDQLLELDGITLVIGHPVKYGQARFNAASILRNGSRLGEYHKMLLSNDEVFDECRYFTPGAAAFVFEQDGTKVGILICSDAWAVEPALEAAQQGAELLLILSASPFDLNKQSKRLQILAYRAEETGLPCAYVNLNGAQDELVFDGASFALNRHGQVVAQAAAFQDELLLLDFNKTPGQPSDFQLGSIARLYGELETVYRALTLSLQDYIRKNNFPGAILGLSGGIDSALTLAIAVDALGADKVHAVMMPSRYTSDISMEDAKDMAKRVNASYHELDIWPLYEQFTQTLAPLSTGLAVGNAEENLQARIRGTLLMALSNKSGYLVITTGNKSELATGYCTLYGDMAGGFSLLKDIPKTMVFELSRWRNQQSEIIPARIIARPPSAELRANQRDEDSLPPYEILDGIMHAYLEKNASAQEIITQGFAADDVNRVLQLLRINEYKRRQAPVGPRITCRAFGKDWRTPIMHRFTL